MHCSVFVLGVFTCEWGCHCKMLAYYYLKLIKASSSLVISHMYISQYLH